MYGCELVNSGRLPLLLVDDENEDDDDDEEEEEADHSRNERTRGMTVTFTRYLDRKAIHEIRSRRATIP